MDKKKVTVEYDKDKFDALDIFLRQNDKVISVEIEHHMSTLYNRYVPPTVRTFLQKKSENEE